MKINCGKVCDYQYSTVGTFRPCITPESTPDFVSDSGSKYWIDGEYLIRNSDHWGAGIGSCEWFLHGMGKVRCENIGKSVTARIKWSSMKRNIVNHFGRIGYFAKENGGSVFVAL